MAKEGKDKRSASMEDEQTNQSNVTNSPKKMWRNPSWKVLILGLVLVTAVIIGALMYNPSEEKTTTPAKTSAEVSIQKDKFFPSVLSVKVGNSVTWTNQDKKAHWVASDPYPKNDALKELNSNPLQQNESYTYTFDKAGTYTYHDQLHPFKLLGTVTVQ